MDIDLYVDSSPEETVGFFPEEETDFPKDYVPSEDEPYMNSRQLAYFHQKLLSWREELVSQLGSNLHQIREDGAKEVDIIDQGTLEANTVLKICSQNRTLKTIEEIDAALDRINSETYGYCKETGEEIGIKRLEARPTATLSLEAQRWLERGKHCERSIFVSEKNLNEVFPTAPLHVRF